MPALTWSGWEQVATDHLIRTATYAGQSHHVIEECLHHGMTEFRIKYRKNGSRQRNCMQCGRERDQRRRDRKKNAA